MFCTPKFISNEREHEGENFDLFCSVKQDMMRSENTSFPIEELMLEAIITYGRPRIRGIRSDILSAIFRLGSGMSGRAACCEV